MLTLIFIALAVIFVTGILAMVEASLFSYSLFKAKVYAARGGWLAKKALSLREKPLKAIATLVVFSTAITVGGSIIIGSLAAKQFSSQGIGIFSAIIIFLTIVIAEVIPKNIGERWTYIIFPIAAIPLKWLTVILSPIIWFLEIIIKPLTSGRSPFMTSEEEIAFLTKEGGKEGTIESHEAEMIQRVFQLNNITAGDIMTLKPFVCFLDGTKTIRELAVFIKNAKHSRFPVFEKDINNIIGVVHQRDLLRALSDGKFDRRVSDYMREAMIIPESRLGDDLLRDFQEKQSHLAVVVSEYGNVLGVVGLEDVLEELVGEIIDEKDVAPEFIKRVSKNEIIAHGQTRIVSVNHFFNTEIKSRKTLNGFLLEQFGSVPIKGQTIELNGLHFQIEEASASQIERVRIIKTDSITK